MELDGIKSVGHGCPANFTLSFNRKSREVKSCLNANHITALAVVRNALASIKRPVEIPCVNDAGKRIKSQLNSNPTLRPAE